MACLGAFLYLLLGVCRPIAPTPVSVEPAFDPPAPAATPAPGDGLARREFIPVQTFLNLDPLAGASAAVAARQWTPALVWAAGLLVVSLVLPRIFCSHICPMGTLIDAFDFLLGRRVSRLHIRRRGWWRYLKYFILAGVLLASLLGTMLAGFVAAVPLVMRGLVLALVPLHAGSVRGWDTLPPVDGWQIAGAAGFVLALLLGARGPRVGCRNLCPTGAVLSPASLLRLAQRNVSADCVSCGQCLRMCDFGAIRDDFGTRPTECTTCQTCGGACPTGAIGFGRRVPPPDGRADLPHPPRPVSLSRRGFLVSTAVTLAAAMGLPRLDRPEGSARDAGLLRPPGALPPPRFEQACIRCGQCIKACPTGLLQVAGIEGGVESLWTPSAMPSFAACDPACTICGSVCPTGAIRRLTPQAKRGARIGLARIDKRTCLAHTGRSQCGRCYFACQQAGYKAIGWSSPPEGGDDRSSAALPAPFVDADACVGCGACQCECASFNVRKQHLLTAPTVVVHPLAVDAP